ncbi:LOW QUALITY PROTEIN: E3 ubiquitin-protein ligase TRIM52-like [Varanus komodoensis]|uniref:LOW QUALITY PROTEIN: E3 ubiquitin-protein ligase TRIM52-like n=1 Tax=Varanus komodoensis TaxID=61221 RepID=UPI001CF7A7C8|nr:LOW QUALITY PROTEIN: E3 ubiquitin-protein ligase TRIM52-like [Varanus komodoensis]
MSCTSQESDSAVLKPKAGWSQICTLDARAKVPRLAFTRRKHPLIDLRKVKVLCAEAMAAAPESTVLALSEESTCPICLDFFRDPVIITECGHNFSRACLRQSGGESDAQASCPQCRGIFQKRILRPNRQLARIVEIARKSGQQTVKGAERKAQACEKHQEPLKLFFRDHEAPIRVVCDRAKEHEGHKVVPLEEASQEYQDLLYRHLESLRDERGRILACKVEAEREKQLLLVSIKNMSWKGRSTSARMGHMEEKMPGNREPMAALPCRARDILQSC